MAIVVPCITEADDEAYKEAIGRVHSFAERIHIDVSDGEFAPTLLVPESRTWWPAEIKADIHAMVARPSEHMATFLALKPHMVTLHAEAVEDIVPHLQQLQKVGIKAGVALIRGTVPSTVAQAIEIADHVMIFSGDLGKQGGIASLMQLEKVRLIRRIRQDIEVGWDGGITLENAFSLAQGGVDVFNVGGTINRAADPAAMYASLVSEINKHGVI